MDDYEAIKKAFEYLSRESVEISEEVVLGEPILTVKIRRPLKIRFHFEVDEYSDEAYFSDLEVIE